MRTFVSDHIEAVILAAFVAIIGVVIVVMLPLIAKEHADWVAWCEQQNGHVVDDTNTSTGTGFTPNGQPVVTTSSSTTYYCLSPEGGIIDIR